MVRKMVLTAAVALMAVPAFASAQQVTATATVADHMAVSGSGDVSFGTVDRVTGASIDPTSGAAATRTLDFNRNVRVTFTNVPTALTAAGGLSLPVSLTCASRIGAGAWSSSAACGTAQFDLDVGAATTSATLGFGGSILGSDAAAAVAATYTGTFDIVVVAR